MNTCAPSATKHLAAPSPIPALPPVTTATLFVSFFSIALFLSLFLIVGAARHRHFTLHNNRRGFPQQCSRRDYFAAGGRSLWSIRDCSPLRNESSVSIVLVNPARRSLSVLPNARGPAGAP